MTDRELLELAAKAAGMPPPVDSNGVWSAWVGTPENGHWWDPLTDDGDALRLAVKLHLHVDVHGPECVTVWAFDGEHATGFDEDCGEDACSDVRRAIVRAAAEIGRSLP